jgi:AraC family transcriptional regulator
MMPPREFWIDRLQVRLLPGKPYSVHGASDEHTLGIALERQSGVHAVGSDRRHDFDTWSGTLAYTPPGMGVFSESQRGGEYLVLTWAADNSCEINERPTLHGQANAMSIALSIRRALLQPCRDSLEVETLSLQMLDAGMKAIDGETSPRQNHDFGPVLDYIETKLSEAITLAELAAKMKLPVLTFLRGFSSTLGMTPHAYIVERRLQHARRLLLAENESIAQVAADCGFSHQSHFGKHFRRAFGMTPRDYRASESPRPTAHEWSCNSSADAKSPLSRRT